ncbi:unnamed protein product [Rhizopus stolonifer]
MTKDNKKLSCKKYLKEYCKLFRIVEFYEYFNFESKQEAEFALKGTVYALSKRLKNNTNQLNQVLNMIKANDFELLKSSAAEAFWARIDAKNMQMISFYALKSATDRQVIKTIEEKQEKEEQEQKVKFEEEQENKAQQEETKTSEAANKKRKYILDISELQKSDNKKCQKLDLPVTPKERLSVSSIKLIKEVVPLPKYKFDESIYLMIKEWETSVRARDDIKFKYSQSEIDYIVKYVSCLLQNMFSMDDPLSIDWDITSFATREIPEGYCAPRPDCIIISHNGIEVGTIEIKPLYTCKGLVEVDFCRIGELCKRQLHLPMKVAKTTKEFKTFGILVNGKQDNICKLQETDPHYLSYVLIRVQNELCNRAINEGGEYKLIQHDTLMIPNFTCNAQQMEMFLETMFSFKNQIMESLVDESEKDKPCIDEQHSHFIKPTIAFKTKAKNNQ